MGTKKRKLNLTVGGEFRERAESLARERNRSVSNLFETLVDEEWERTHPGETNPSPRIAETPPDAGADGTPPGKKIGFMLKSQATRVLAAVARGRAVSSATTEKTATGSNYSSTLK